MPNWKKVVTSGSNAHLNHITASGNISASGNGFFNDLTVANELLTTNLEHPSANGGNPSIRLDNQYKVEIGDIESQTNETILTVDDANNKVTTTCEIEVGGELTAQGVSAQTLEATNTSDATDFTGDTGVLKVEGGASIAKKVYVGTDLNVAGNILNSQFVQMTNSSSVIDTFNTGSFRSAKYVLQVTSGSNYQVSEMLVLHHDNLTASNTEYAQLNSGLNLLDFTTSVSGANVKLNAAGSFLSCSVRYDRTIIPI